MALQSQVFTKMAPAIAGMPAVVVENHFTAETYQAASALTVGNFCFADATDPNTKVNAAGTGLVRGVVIYTKQYVAPCGTTNTMQVPQGEFVQIGTEGKFWVAATNANAAVGQNVFASQTDGSVTTQTGTAALADHTLTNFVVEKVLGTEAGSLVLISNQTPTPVAPAA